VVASTDVPNTLKLSVVRLVKKPEAEESVDEKKLEVVAFVVVLLTAVKPVKLPLVALKFDVKKFDVEALVVTRLVEVAEKKVALVEKRLVEEAKVE
jgi:hypothetical protein